ncbi:MAG: 16S rRNA (guanine(966)-N(2))-methyltransferase RsmD [Clostridia bacterium]|nr:16S rRNA (guanine(966)-N(2))-methyltransferase RsmD [Clostridia bacterium]
MTRYGEYSTLRIIAGTARGRTIESPKGRDTRPTLDRVREAIFGAIQFDVENACVLDLFAGSGALGLEALSRGARCAVFCDSSKDACLTVEKNLKELELYGRSLVVCADALMTLERFANEKREFSLVFLDPPYASDLYKSAIEKLVLLGLLADGCILILEHDKRREPDIAIQGLEKLRQHRYGDVAVTKYIYSSEKADASSTQTEAEA